MVQVLLAVTGIDDHLMDPELIKNFQAHLKVTEITFGLQEERGWQWLPSLYKSVLHKIDYCYIRKII